MRLTTPHPKKHTTQKGYSLVELSVALAIVAVILVGALMGTRQILLTNSVNNQIKESATVISKIQRQFAKQTNTAGATTSQLAPLGIWPGQRAINANGIWTVRGVINGSSEFVFSNTAALGTLPANGGFIYTLRGVPLEACAELVTALDTVSFAIYAGPTSATPPADGTTPASTAVKAPDSDALNITNLGAACAATATSSSASGTPVTTAVNAVDIAVVFRQ